MAVYYGYDNSSRWLFEIDAKLSSPKIYSAFWTAQIGSSVQVTSTVATHLVVAHLATDETKN